MMGMYKGAEFGELSPHPFAMADRAYRCVFSKERAFEFFVIECVYISYKYPCCRLMMNYGISQAILVSGESGAGKTESTKMLMQYLAFMGGKVESGGRSVQQQVLEVRLSLSLCATTCGTLFLLNNLEIVDMWIMSYHLLLFQTLIISN